MASLSWAREAVEVSWAARPSRVGTLLLSSEGGGCSEAFLAMSERPLRTAGVRLGVVSSSEVCSEVCFTTSWMADPTAEKSGMLESSGL